jgi:hypothetical protein
VIARLKDERDVGRERIAELMQEIRAIENK